MQPMRSASLFGGALLSAGFTASAEDITVFDQTPNGVVAYASNEPGSYLDFQQADDFTLGASYTQVTGASWVGVEEALFSDDFPPGNIAGFNVSIFADDEGLPGEALLSRDFAIEELSVTDLGIPLQDSTAFEISADFQFDGAAGETYWFSTIALLDQSFEDNWFWAATSESDRPGWAGSVFGESFFPRLPTDDANGLAFSIRAVPTPGTAGLLGLAGLAAARRAHRGRGALHTAFKI